MLGSHLNPDSLKADSEEKPDAVTRVCVWGGGAQSQSGHKAWETRGKESE